MDEFTASEWLAIALALVTLIAGVFGWLFNRLLHQHATLAKERKDAAAELQVEKDRHESSTFSNIAEKIEGLVAQITSLFSGQREIHEEFKKVYKQINDNHSEVKSENALVLGLQREQVIRCGEREKILLDVKNVQREHIAKFGKEISNHMRLHPPVRSTDKEPLACTNGKNGEVE